MVSSDLNVVIFSKDRAMQLDVLLRSYDTSRIGAPVIVWATSSSDFRESYTQLGAYPVRWYATHYSFSTFWYDPHVLKQSKPYTMFLCDDDVFYRPIPEIPEIPKWHCFSLRLGKNVTHCYSKNCPQREGQLDFVYPWSLDGHIYHTDELLRALQVVVFDNPNELEDQLNKCCPGPKIMYAEHSCLVGLPHNRVQDKYKNRCGSVSAKELNDKFLAGYRIDLDALDFSAIIGTHQEVPLVFKHI